MLTFLLGTFVILVVIYLTIVSHPFRRAAFMFVVLVTVGITFLVKHSEKEEQERQQQIAAQNLWAVTAIRPDQVVLTDMKLAKETFGDYWVLSGTIANNSTFNLGSIQFLVTITDCVPEKCRTIGQETAEARTDDSWRHRPLVPARQVRSFTSYAMDFKNMPPAMALQWEAKVVEIRAALQAAMP